MLIPFTNIITLASLSKMKTLVCKLLPNFNLLSLFKIVISAKVMPWLLSTGYARTFFEMIVTFLTRFFYVLNKPTLVASCHFHSFNLFKLVTHKIFNFSTVKHQLKLLHTLVALNNKIIMFILNAFFWMMAVICAFSNQF